MSAKGSLLTRVGAKYEVLSRLGVGGMAELYVARTQASHGFEKIVALKRILPHLVEDEDFAKMFLAEARLAALLHHPNIAQVYDFGEDDGTFFFTMEYVLGQDLRRIVRALRSRDGWLTLDHTIFIVAQIAAALHYAHEKEDSDGKPLKIVHRDVSPSNILVSYDGGVKLVDFGIARATLRSETTSAGTLKGKVPYMSPEQCRGEPLDRRSDVFSLGVVLWELACCRRLFVGESDLQLAQRIAHEDAPSPTAYLPHFPTDLERIIMRALARDRDQRYASAQELQIDLEELARERKLALSSVSLARLMNDLFADTIQAQKAALVEAKAGREGRFPEQESVSSSEEAPPISRSLTLTAADVRPPPRRAPALLIGSFVVAAAAAAAAWHFLGGSPAAAVALDGIAAGREGAAAPSTAAPKAAPTPTPVPSPALAPDPEPAVADGGGVGGEATTPTAVATPTAAARKRGGKAGKKGARSTPPPSTEREGPKGEAANGDVPADIKDPFRRVREPTE